MNQRKCAIIGAGNVGATTAFSLMQARLFSQIVLIDLDHARAEGEAADLSHAMPLLAPTEIYAGSYEDLADAAIIVITAGTAKIKGGTRLDLVHENYAIFKRIIESICKYNNDAILIVVTNPVDILTQVTRRLSGFPRGRVIGSGTVLDTARLKFLLGNKLGVDNRQVHAFIIGEHGDSELPVFSSANISGIDLDHFCNDRCAECDRADLQSLFEQTRDSAYQIVRQKGSTCYGIAEATRRIISAILFDESAILPVSVDPEGAFGIEDLSISLPALIGKEGIKRVLPLPLSASELTLLQHSAARMREVLDSVMPH